MQAADFSRFWGRTYLDDCLLFDHTVPLSALRNWDVWPLPLRDEVLADEVRNYYP